MWFHCQYFMRLVCTEVLTFSLQLLTGLFFAVATYVVSSPRSYSQRSIYGHVLSVANYDQAA
jgi:hypothetical protein